jgi:hypothetical protein
MSTLICNSDELTRFTGVFSDVALVYELAPHLTGRETQAIAGLFRALGEMATADLWIAAHRSANQPPTHPVEEYIVPVDPDGRPALRQLPIRHESPKRR